MRSLTNGFVLSDTLAGRGFVFSSTDRAEDGPHLIDLRLGVRFWPHSGSSASHGWSWLLGRADEGVRIVGLTAAQQTLDRLLQFLQNGAVLTHNC